MFKHSIKHKVSFLISYFSRLSLSEHAIQPKVYKKLCFSSLHFVKCLRLCASIFQPCSTWSGGKEHETAFKRLKRTPWCPATLPTAQLSLFP